MKYSKSKPFVEKLKDFNNKFNLVFYIMVTTLFIIIIIATFSLAEFTRLRDGLEAIFPEKPDWILDAVSWGLLLAFITIVGINTISNLDNNNSVGEKRIKHTVRSRIMSVIKFFIGESKEVIITPRDKIIDIMHLIEYGIILLSVSGTLYRIFDEIFAGENISLLESFGYIISNITFNQTIELVSVLVFSLLIVFGLPPFAEFAVTGGYLEFKNIGSTKANEIVEKYKAMKYRTLAVLKGESKRIKFDVLDKIDNDFNLLYKLVKRDESILINIVNLDTEKIYEGDFSPNNRESTVDLIITRLQEDKTE